MPENPSTPTAGGTRHHDSTAGELSDAQIAVVREAFAWITDPDSVSAVMLLDLLADAHAHYLAVRLARELHTRRPGSITQELTPLLSLAVAVAAINAGAVSPTLDPDDDDELAQEVARLNHRIHGLYATEAAATAARREFGDAPRVELAFQAGYLVVTPTSA